MKEQRKEEKKGGKNGDGLFQFSFIFFNNSLIMHDLLEETSGRYIIFSHADLALEFWRLMRKKEDLER